MNITKPRLATMEVTLYSLALIFWIGFMTACIIRHAHPRVVVSYPKPSPVQPVVPFTNDDLPLGPALDVPGAVSAQQQEIERGGDEP